MREAGFRMLTLCMREDELIGSGGSAVEGGGGTIWAPEVLDPIDDNDWFW